MSRALVAVIALALAPLAAHAGKAPPPPPTLKDLKRAAPEVRAGETVAPDPDRAKELYRRFLELEGGDPGLRTEAMRRLGDLQIEAGDSARGETAGLGEAETREAIEIYTRLLEQQPDYARADVVLYQLSRGWESLGEADKALAYLDTLVAKYPASPRLDEAQFRRGEILFSAKRYPEAQKAYEAASAFGAKSEFYEQSLYKLGWSLFKQSENEASFDPFVRVLDLKLVDAAQAGGVVDPAALPRADRELVQDTFRVLSIAFSYVEGQETLDDFVAARGEIPYAFMLYSELGDLYVGKQRFTDAADSYRAFVDRYPNHERAPLLQMQAIEAYKKGGFAQLVLDGKKEFVERYQLGSPFWAGRTPEQFPLVARELKTNLTDLAQYYHAEAQRTKKKPDYHEAARWYREFLQSFPDDPESAKTNYLLAETLFESGEFRAAATEYERTAYAYPFHDKSAEAGYAALVCYEREAKSTDGATAAAWNRQRLESQQRFAVTFPAHAESATLLTRTAREYYDLKDLPKALEVAGLVLARRPPVDAAMQRTAWTVTGNAQFDTGRFADAEGAYLQVQSLLAPQDAETAAINERLAASIYKQGEAKQAAGDAAGAVDDYLRVGRLAPGASIRETAEFDAGALLVSLKDWPRAIPVLESFRAGFPASARQADVTRNLALAYLEGGRTGEAAGEFERMASSDAETPEVQRNALWQAAELYEKSAQPARAMATYESYVARFPAPLPEAIEARLKLADYAGESGDYLGRRKSLEGIVAADRDAGGARTDRSRYLAAVATLELTEASRDAFQSIALVAPLKDSLASKKSAMERALAGYQQAVGYAVAEVTTAATFRDGRTVPPARRGPDEVRAPGKPRCGVARAVRPPARGAGLPVRGEGSRGPRGQRAPRDGRPLRRLGAQELRRSRRGRTGPFRQAGRTRGIHRPARAGRTCRAGPGAGARRRDAEKGPQGRGGARGRAAAGHPACDRAAVRASRAAARGGRLRGRAAAPRDARRERAHACRARGESRHAACARAALERGGGRPRRGLSARSGRRRRAQRARCGAAREWPLQGRGGDVSPGARRRPGACAHAP